MGSFADFGTYSPVELGPGLSSKLKLPLPKNIRGKYEDWEDWAWTFKSYLSVMDQYFHRSSIQVEDMEVEITDADLVEREDEPGTRARLEFVKPLHNLLVLVVDDGARLLIRQNTKGTGLETWRLYMPKVHTSWHSARS